MDKINFIKELKKDKRVINIEKYHDFFFIHVQHSLSRESKSEIRIFYNPEYILLKPVHVSKDGWEYWEVACLNRNELNKIINSSINSYHGELFSVKQERLYRIASLEFMPYLTEKQLEAIRLAYKEGYYEYPRKLTLPDLSKKLKKSYSTYQENLRKAEKKIVDYFFKNR